MSSDKDFLSFHFSSKVPQRLRWRRRQARIGKSSKTSDPVSRWSGDMPTHGRNILGAKDVMSSLEEKILP